MKVAKTTKEKVRIPASQKDERSKKKKDKKLSKGSTALVVQSDELPKVKMKDIKSTFGKQAPAIVQMLEMNDSDGALTLLKKVLLQTTIKLVPYTEKMVRESKSQRGIYQFTTLVSQVRELMADIQADQDRKYIAQSLVRSVIQPAFMDIAQNIITEHHAFRKLCEGYIVPKHTQKFNEELQALAKLLAKYMMEQYKEVETKTYEQLKN